MNRLYRIVDDSGNLLTFRHCKWFERRKDKRGVEFSLTPYLICELGDVIGVEVFLGNRKSCLNYISTYKHLRWSQKYLNEEGHVKPLKLRIERNK